MKYGLDMKDFYFCSWCFWSAIFVLSTMNHFLFLPYYALNKLFSHVLIFNGGSLWIDYLWAIKFCNISWNSLYCSNSKNYIFTSISDAFLRMSCVSKGYFLQHIFFYQTRKSFPSHTLDFPQQTATINTIWREILRQTRKLQLLLFVVVETPPKNILRSDIFNQVLAQNCKGYNIICIYGVIFTYSH